MFSTQMIDNSYSNNHLYICNRNLPVKGQYFVAYSFDSDCGKHAFSVKKCEIGCEYFNTGSKKSFFVDGQLMRLKPNVLIASTDCSFGVHGINLDSILQYCNYPSDEVNVKYLDNNDFELDSSGCIYISNPDLEAWDRAIYEAEQYANNRLAARVHWHASLPASLTNSWYQNDKIDYLRKNYNIHTK